MEFEPKGQQQSKERPFRSGPGETPASPDFRFILTSAPTLHEVLARPMVYEAWLAKAKEALNG